MEMCEDLKNDRSPLGWSELNTYNELQGKRSLATKGRIPDTTMSGNLKYLCYVPTCKSLTIPGMKRIQHSIGMKNQILSFQGRRVREEGIDIKRP